MADYLASLEDLPVFPSVRPGDIQAALPSEAPASGEPLSEMLRDFRDIIVPGLNHWNHPSFFGYFAVSGSGPGILGEMLASVLNVNAMVWRSSPAATELEDVTTDWVRRLIGLRDGFEGVINDTASSSSLYALAAAREVAFPGVGDTGLAGRSPGVVYASDQAHSSIAKAVITLGLGRDGFHAVASDTMYRMDVGALRRQIRSDLEAGRRPVAVVATAGTTSTASMDPLSDIAEVAEEFDLWYHVDAAYGGPAAMLPELAEGFAGWNRADSVIVNPHKWLYTPIDCSVLFCRRPEALVQAFSIVPEYLAHGSGAEGRDLMNYGVSLGRRFRALKLWFVLRYFGRDGLVDRIRYQIALGAALAEQVKAEAGWEVVTPATLALVVFRCTRGDDLAATNDLNERIRDRVNASGRAFLTHTVLDGRVVLRLSIGNIKTSREHVDDVWAALREAAEAEA